MVDVTIIERETLLSSFQRRNTKSLNDPGVDTDQMVRLARARMTMQDGSCTMNPPESVRRPLNGRMLLLKELNRLRMPYRNRRRDGIEYPGRQRDRKSAKAIVSS